MMKTYGPYTPIRQAGDLFFVSGQVGVDPDTKSASKNIAEQTSQALMNMSSLLEANDLDMNDIVKTTIFVTDMSLFGEVNDIYEGYFLKPRPARSTVAVKELPRVADNPIMIEIEAVAKKRK